VPKVAADERFLSVSFGEIAWLFRENFLISDLAPAISNNFSKADPQNLFIRVGFVPIAEVNNVVFDLNKKQLYKP